MKTFDLHQDIAANIQLVTGKDFFKTNGLNEGRLADTEYHVVNQVDLPRLLKADVELVFATIFATSKTQALAQIEIYKALVKKNKNIFFVLGKADLKRIKKGSLGLLLSIEGAGCFDSLADLDLYYSLGVRALGPLWRSNNIFFQKGIITSLGRQLLGKLQKDKKIILDLAHVPENLFWDILKIYKDPFIVSHTACNGVFKSERNLSDRELLEVGKRGGLVGISFVNLMVGGKKISDVVKNVEYAVNKTSIDNVCLGSDFDGMVNSALSVIKGLEDASKYQNLTDELSQKYSTQKLRKILYTNVEKFLTTRL